MKSEPGRNKRLETVQEWHKFLNKQYSDIANSRGEANKFLNQDPSIVTVIENRSKVTTNDMQQAINDSMPDILETIAGVDEPLKLDPDEAKWVDPAKKLQALGNSNIKRKNKWYRICYNFLKDSMALKFGCIKYTFMDESIVIEKHYKDLQDEEIQGLTLKEGTAVVSDEKSEDGKRLTIISYTTNDQYVKYHSVPSERIKFPIDTRSFDDCPIVIEEVQLYEHKFIETYGKDFFNRVREMKDQLEKTKGDSAFTDRFKDLGMLDYVFDNKSNKYKAYEAYFYYDSKPWVMIYCGDEVHTDEKNRYRKPPYRGGSAFLLAHRLIGEDYYDTLKDIQVERTYFKRLITDIVSQNANRRYFVDIEGCGMNIEDYENNSAMNALIRCTAPPEQFIVPEQKTPLYPEMIQYWELMNAEKDKEIPTPRSFTGLQGASDERTYRGKQLKVNQASKKLLMMMRGYMEEVFAPLFQDTLDCIAMFMDKRTVVRYLDQDYDIAPDEIICKYAVIVNCGLGTHDKQDKIVKLQQAIGLAMQLTQFGVTTPQDLWYTYQELLKAMDFLNTTDFCTDPKVKETIIQLLKMVMEMITHFAQIPHLNPEIQSIGMHIMQMSHEVLNALGVQEQSAGNKGGANVQGTAPGQNTPELPHNPANVMNPSTQITGGGFFA